MIAAALTLAACASGCVVWLPASTDAPDQNASASRRAPVIEYAYGPRARLNVGARVEAFELRGESSRWRLEARLLASVHDAQADGIGPDELLDESEELALAWQPWFEPAAERFELELALGHHGAHRQHGLSLGEPRPNDIPFGGGGYWIAPALVIGSAPGGDFGGYVRFGHRIFINALPELFGAKEVSDTVASLLAEGLAHSPALEGSLRFRGWRAVEPLVSVSFEGLFPADDSARPGWVLRALGGAALPGELGELIPYVEVDVGNGPGLLVNQRRARLALGARLAL